LIDEFQRDKASVCAKVEQVLRPIKCQFGHVMVRRPSSKRKTQQLTALFALSNMWMEREVLWVLTGKVYPKTAITTWKGRKRLTRRA
jgi:IS5 family transposase